MFGTLLEAVSTFATKICLNCKHWVYSLKTVPVLETPFSTGFLNKFDRYTNMIYAS